MHLKEFRDPCPVLRGRGSPVMDRCRTSAFRWPLLIWLAIAVCGWSPVARGGDGYLPKGTNLTSLVVISGGNLPNTAQQVLIATLQGLVARQSSQQIYIDGGSGYSLWPAHLTSHYGITVRTETSAWNLLADFHGLVRGYIRYDYAANTNSLNAANSLCGPNNAVAVDASIESAVRNLGITNLIADVSKAGDQFVWTNAIPDYKALLSRRVVTEQKQTIVENLRDYVTMADSLVFYEGDDPFRTSVMASMNADAVCLGWGDNESVFIGNSSANGVFTCGSDWALDLSTLSSIRDTTVCQHTYDHPTPGTNVHYVTFLVTDGDNVQWNLGGLPAYYDSPARGSFNMGWALSPSLADLAPSVMRWFYDTASNAPGRDFFVAGASGVGYFYPSMFPAQDLALQANLLDDFMLRADMNICQILDFDSFGRLDLWNKYLAEPAIDGLFYLEYAPYNGAHGAIEWSASGKPVIGARDLLWAGIEEETNLIANLNSYPTDASSPSGYTLVAVHVWSKELANVLAVMTNLASSVRVVTPGEFVRLIRDNVGRKLSYDFTSGLQGWVMNNASAVVSTFLGPANPGFEQAGADWYAGGTGGTAGSVSFSNPTENGPTEAGTNCVSETSNGAGNTDFRASYFSLGAAAKGTNEVTFSFDYNLINAVKPGNNVRVGLRFFDVTGNNFQGEDNCHVGAGNGDAGADGWHHYSATFTPPSTAYMADIRVSMNVFGDDAWSNGAVLFDNFAVSAGVVAQTAGWTAKVGNPAGALMLSGSNLAVSNGPAGSAFSRQIVLPANVSRLGFDTMATNDGLLRVRVQDASGTSATLLDWSGLTNHGVWTNQTVSLAGYAGQTVILFFEQANGGQGVNEERYVDNVTILANGSPIYLPAPPRLLSAVNTNGLVNLSWRDNDENESGLVMERCLGTNGDWSVLASLSTNQTTYVDSAVTPGRVYSYRVNSWNAAGTNVGLNVITLTALPRTPLGPANPGFEAQGISWNSGGSGGAAGSIDFSNPGQNGPAAPGTNCVAEASNGTGNTDFRANPFSLGAAAAGAYPVTFSFDYNIAKAVTAGNDVRVGLRFFDSTGSVFQGENNGHVGAENGDAGGVGWRHFRVTLTPPATAYMADIRVSMNTFGDDAWSNGPVWFDNFAVAIGSNSLPVASNFNVGTLTGLPITIRIIGGSHAPVDADGNPLMVSAVGAPGHGTVTTDGTSIRYVPSAGYGGSDGFTYTVSDGLGGIATAEVSVLVSAQTGAWLETPSVLGQGGVQLTFQGAPLNLYALDWATNLVPPIAWQPQTTNTADAAGLLVVTNLSSGSAGFWRMRQVAEVP